MKPFKKPPVIEAVSEFRFAPQKGLQTKLVDQFFDKIKKTLPVRKKVQQSEMIMAFKPNQTTLKQEQKLIVREKYAFTNEANTFLVQIDEGQLVVSHLKPYSSWDIFFPLIKQVLTSFVSVFKPEQKVGFGLRYVNHIFIPEEQFDLKKYFALRPYIGEKLPQNFGALDLKLIFNIDENNKIKVALSELINKESELAKMLFDIDVINRKIESVNVKEFLIWIDKAHKKLEEIFENALTEKTKNLFQ